jgi:hypothetical protein
MGVHILNKVKSATSVRIDRSRGRRMSSNLQRSGGFVRPQTRPRIGVSVVDQAVDRRLDRAAFWPRL